MTASPGARLVVEADIIDGVGATTRRSQAIVIEGETVSDVLPLAAIGSGFDTFDRVAVKYGVVMPGMIDAHVHACGWPFGMADATGCGAVGRFVAHASRNLATAAAAGITTVRDLGGGTEAPYVIKRAWRDGVLDGARPVVAGPMITAVGGHGMERAVPFGVEVTGEVEIRRAVRRAIAAGADVIKVVTSGLVTRTELTLAELRAAVDEAHWSGVSVASHANFSVRGIENSVEAGCDSIEHGCVASQQTLDEMALRGIALCPTLLVMERIREAPEQYGGASAPLVSAIERTWESHQRGVGYAYRAGVPIVAGTDAGISGVTFDALVDELLLLQRCGLPTAEALRAVTSNPARLMRRPDLGTIAAGSAADLLVLAENPLEDLEGLRSVSGVMVRGQWVVCPPVQA